MPIDPDAVVLHKEIKTKHTQLKKALKGLHSDDITKCLHSVFGSSCDHSTVTDNNYNTSEVISWMGPIESNIGAIFNAKMDIHLNDDSECTHVDMNDKWIYGAMLPLSLKLDLHEEWSKLLGYLSVMLTSKAYERHMPLHNVWQEQPLLGYMNFDSEERPGEFSSQDAWALKATMQALHEDSATATQVWPNLAPWLHAMETLDPAPDCAKRDGPYVLDQWTTWGQNIRQMYYTAHAAQPEDNVILPDLFLSPENT